MSPLEVAPINVAQRHRQKKIPAAVSNSSGFPNFVFNLAEKTNNFSPVTSNFDPCTSLTYRHGQDEPPNQTNMKDNFGQGYRSDKHTDTHTHTHNQPISLHGH